MIEIFDRISITKTSHPQATAVMACPMDEYDYIEEEYFFAGRANVYELKGKEAAIRYAGAPYVNRMLVRRPKDGAKASGRVIIEILNATSGMDIDRMWAIMHMFLMRNGDTYIGVTSKPSSLRTMKKLDPVRYSPLHWNNPEPRHLPQCLKERHIFCGAISEDSEAGLFWDMLTDVAVAVRKERLPLGIKPDKIYLAGWSQSTIYMVLYLNYFAYRNGASPFDGYYSGGGVRCLAPGLNQYDLPESAGEYGTILHRVTEPYIAIQTESENHALGNDAVIQQDSDDPQFLYRIYDVPGATHDCTSTMEDYYRGNGDLKKLGLLLTYPAKDPYPNNYPYSFPFNSACAMLYRWAEKGEVPARMKRIPVGFNGQNLRDLLGNARDGWRMPAVDCPICTYVPFPETVLPAAFSLYGSRHPFPPERLKQLYGNLSGFKRQVEENAAQAVRDGRLLQEDYVSCVDFSVQQAMRGGLT
jgi:hypothetical protein